jgi:hypothetical protein
MHKSFYPQHSCVLTDEKRKILAVICRRPGGWDKVNIVQKIGEKKRVGDEHTCSSNIRHEQQCLLLPFSVLQAPVQPAHRWARGGWGWAAPWNGCVRESMWIALGVCLERRQCATTITRAHTFCWSLDSNCCALAEAMLTHPQPPPGSRKNKLQSFLA